MLRVKVLGGGREVGRSAIALRYGEGKFLLLDYGVNFNEKDEPQFPEHLKPSEVAGLVISHAHLDHVGSAPMLYSSVKLPTVTTSITKALSEVMLKDFIKLSGYYLPFEELDVLSMLENTVESSYNTEHHMGEFTVKLLNAGHIPGSAMVYVEIDRHKILYTGDVNTIDTRLVPKANYEGLEAEVLIIEGTYGNITHPPREVVEKEFIDSVKEVTDAGGNVLIPAFSLGRSQEILGLLYEKFGGEVFYDGMVRQIYDVLISYPEFINKYDVVVKSMKEFKAVVKPSQRRRIVQSKGSVVVASAGMLKGGPAQYYLKKFSSNPKNAIFLVSYQAPGTPGRALLEEGVPLEDVGVVKARVQWFDFSSHAGVDGLLEIVKNVRGLEYVVIVHTNEDIGLEFKQKIEEIVGLDSVLLPSNGEELLIP